MKTFNILSISISASFLILTSLSFTSSEFTNNAFSIKCYEYAGTRNANLENYSNDYIIQSQFVKSSNWTLKENELTLCGPGTYINRICLDTTQLKNGVTLQAILKALYKYIEEFQVPNHGSSISLKINGVPVSVTIYLRHKHEEDK